MKRQIVMSENEYEVLENDSNRLEYLLSLFKFEDKTLILSKDEILSLILSKKLVDDGYKQVEPVYGSGKLILLQGTNSNGQTKEMELSNFDIKIK